MKRKSISCVAVLGALGVVACSSNEAPDGSVRGELRIANISFGDGHSEREFYLAENGSEELRRLVFSHEPTVPALSELKVWGTIDGENLMVDRYELDQSASGAPIAEVEEPLLNGTKRTRSVGFVLMDIGGGVNLTLDQAQQAAFGTRGASNASLKEYYLEASYNTLEFTGSVFETDVSLPSGCSTNQLMTIANGWAAQFGQTLDHWMGYIGSNTDECEWGGVGWEGNATRAERVSFYNASSSCVVLAQEIGHNLGWMHAGTMDCGTAIMADDTSTCSGNEYGSRVSPMGGACLHLNAYDKWYQRIFGGCNGVRASATGTFTLLPIEIPCDGVQAIQVPMPKTRAFRNTSGSRDVSINRYYLELRTKRGLDNKNTIPGPRVFVHVAGDVPASNQTATFDWVLDMDPTTTGFDGMNVGQTFNDPAGGVSFTVQAMDNDRATINVTVSGGSGSPTCMDGTTFTAPGPTSCGASTGGMGGMGGMGTAGMGGRGGMTGMGGSAGRGGAAMGGMGGSPQAGAGGTAGSGVAGMPGGGEAGTAGLGGAGPGGAGGIPGAGSGGAPVTGGAGIGASGGAGVGTPGAGTGGSAVGTGGSVAGAAGAAPGPAATPAPLADDPGGCGCRTAPLKRASSTWWALSLVALGWLRRRRAR